MPPKVTLKRTNEEESSDLFSEEEVIERKEITTKTKRLRELNLNLEDGRFLIVGSSGSGKTTLVRAIIKELSRDDRLIDIFWFGASHAEEKWLAKGRGSSILTEERIKVFVDVMKQPAMKNKYVCCILDDIAMMKSHNNKVFNSFISQASRHYRIIILASVQKNTLISPVFRENLSRMFIMSASNNTIQDMYKESNEKDFYKFREHFDTLGKRKGIGLYIDRSSHEICKVEIPNVKSL